MRQTHLTILTALFAVLVAACAGGASQGYQTAQQDPTAQAAATRMLEQLRVGETTRNEALAILWLPWNHSVSRDGDHIISVWTYRWPLLVLVADYVRRHGAMPPENWKADLRAPVDYRDRLIFLTFVNGRLARVTTT